MGMKFCPNCDKIVDARVLGGYRHVVHNGIPVKVRRIVHREEDGGCGFRWDSVEIPADYLPGFKKRKE